MASSDWFISQLLHNILGLDEKLLLFQVHRSLRIKPKKAKPPSALALRVHYYHIWDKIFLWVAEAHVGSKLSIFPEWSYCLNMLKELLLVYPLGEGTLKVVLPLLSVLSVYPCFHFNVLYELLVFNKVAHYIHSIVGHNLCRSDSNTFTFISSPTSDTYSHKNTSSRQLGGCMLQSTSWNIKGLNQPVRSKVHVLQYLPSLGAHIAFLQETHMKDIHQSRLHKWWVVNCFIPISIIMQGELQFSSINLCYLSNHMPNLILTEDAS